MVLWTQCPQAIRSRYIHKVVHARRWPPVFNGQTNALHLDDAYEQRPNMHIVRAYAQAAHVAVSDLRGDMQIAPQEIAIAAKHGAPKSYVVLDMSITWPSRTWDTPAYVHLAKMIQQRGYKVITVGEGKRNIPGTTWIFGQTVFTIAAFISRAKAFVGPDSLLAHIAQAVNTPSVVLFGSTKSEYRVAPQARVTIVRRGDLQCLGCHHKPPFPKHYTECHLPPGRKNICMNMPAESVFGALQRLL